MRGILELTAESRDGRTILTHRRARPPFFVSKPYDRGGALEVQVQQVGPGLFGGDEAAVRVEIKNGASLFLTTPSATRVLPRGGQAAVLTQDIVVRAGAALESWPEPLYPHRGASFRQETRLFVEPGASALWFEALAPGRDASGERHLWEALDLTTSLWEGDRILLRERLRADGAQWRALIQAFPRAGAWTGTLIAYGPRVESVRRAARALEKGEARVGVSEPRLGLLALKFMADDGHAVRTLRDCLRHGAEAVPV